MHTFLTEYKSPFATMFEDTKWLAQLAYLPDVFSKLNDLNLTLQGKDSNVLHLLDKVNAFMKKTEIWKRACTGGDFSCFPQLHAYLSTEDNERVHIKPILEGHLDKIVHEFQSYFPDIEERSAGLDWVRNPFLLPAEINCLQTFRKSFWTFPQTVACR